MGSKNFARLIRNDLCEEAVQIAREQVESRATERPSLCVNAPALAIDVRDPKRYDDKRCLIDIPFALFVTMKLTTQTDYALRTLMFLATRRSRSNVAEVASLFGISANLVAKVVKVVSSRRHGYIHSTRGIGGGIESGPATKRHRGRRRDPGGRARHAPARMRGRGRHMFDPLVLQAQGGPC